MKDVFSDSLGGKKQQPTNRQDILYFHVEPATISIATIAIQQLHH